MRLEYFKILGPFFLNKRYSIRTIKLTIGPKGRETTENKAALPYWEESLAIVGNLGINWTKQTMAMQSFAMSLARKSSRLDSWMRGFEVVVEGRFIMKVK